MRTLAERIRSARLNAGIGEVADLAHRVGVKPAAAYQWESGKTRSLKAETAIALADVLGVSVRWLATGKGRPDGDKSLAPCLHAVAHPPGVDWPFPHVSQARYNALSEAARRDIEELVALRVDQAERSAPRKRSSG